MKPHAEYIRRADVRKVQDVIDAAREIDQHFPPAKRKLASAEINAAFDHLHAALLRLDSRGPE